LKNWRNLIIWVFIEMPKLPCLSDPQLDVKKKKKLIWKELLLRSTFIQHLTFTWNEKKLLTFDLNEFCWIYFLFLKPKKFSTFLHIKKTRKEREREVDDYLISTFEEILLKHKKCIPNLLWNLSWGINKRMYFRSLF
jgi:hypothetical protein